jgi:flavin reductase (DIM6/NTAB) family NADH-FMN oxidoreductase RutF
MQPVNLKLELLRETLGLFPTGIAVVTAKAADGALYGVTVNSFSSVSLDPPLVLFSLARRLHTLAALRSAGAFAIHFLREDQQHLSGRFAKPSPDKWEGVQRRAGVTGSPILEPALALLECRLYAQYDGGDHVILVGRITHREQDAASNPLAFFRGRYHTIGSATPALETKLP